MGNGFEDYIWLDQGTALHQAAADLGETLQAPTSVQSQSAVDNQGLRRATPSLDDRLTNLEDRLGGLEEVIQNLRNE
jgi:hypothetical protein